ncbi:MAG: GNAT family N-acetyltransferase [Clostridiales bacterium]|nr:GNAT family N-acetyltransferase [Clostridiales bacterium]
MIRFIEDKETKKRITRSILEALTEWFEVEESRESYIEESAELPMFASFEDKTSTDANGFLCLKRTGDATVELAVMGVLKECHRTGVGRRLFAAAKDYAVQQGYTFMQVKTVKTGMYSDYDITNAFYRSLGFRELEVFPLLWDEANPCQIYIMNLKSAVNVISTRHSYRGAFVEEPVPEEDLKIIASAGLNAPSGCNKQTTDLIVVNDPEVLSKIKAVLDPPVAQTAPAMIIVLTQRINAYRDRCFAVQDYSAAIQNMLLAIVELGYQSCWYEGHITDEDRICDKIGEILNVPAGFDVVCILPVGKAAQDFHAPSKKKFSERVKFNGWS